MTTPPPRLAGPGTTKRVAGTAARLPSPGIDGAAMPANRAVAKQRTEPRLFETGFERRTVASEPTDIKARVEAILERLRREFPSLSTEEVEALRGILLLQWARAPAEKVNAAGQAIPKTLFSTPSAAAALVRIWSQGYGGLSPALKEDRLVIESFLQGNRGYSPELPKALLGDRDFILATLPLIKAYAHETGFEHVDEALRRDEAFLLEAAGLNPDIIWGAHPEALASIPFAREIAARSPYLLSPFPSTVYDDPEVLQSVRSTPGILPTNLPESLTRDSEFLRERMAQHALNFRSFFPDGVWLAEPGNATRADGTKVPSWAGDPRDLLRAEGTHFYTLIEASDPDLMRDLAAEALGENRSILDAANLQPLLTEDAFLERVLRADPLLLDGLRAHIAALPSVPKHSSLHRSVMSSGTSLQSLADEQHAALTRVLEAAPEIEAEHRALRAQLDQLGITNIDVIGALPLVREVIAHRLNPVDDTDTRPLAVVLQSPEDWNRAFELPNRVSLFRHRRVLYFEVRTDTQLVEALREVQRSGQQAELLVIGGHGSQKVLALGASDPASGRDPLEELDLDLSDEATLVSAGLSDVLASNGHLVLFSCSNGKGREEAENVANMMGRVFPHAVVHAATAPTNGQLQFAADGTFLDPGFLQGGLISYRQEPTSPRLAQ